MQAEWGSKAKDMKIKSPFLKAEEFKYEGSLPGWTVLRLTSDSKPTVLDAAQNAGSLIKLTEEDPETVYPGRWCTVSLNCFAYDVNGNKGVSFGLNNIMLLNHDDSLGGRMKAEDEFEAPEGSFAAAGGSETGDAEIDSMFD